MNQILAFFAFRTVVVLGSTVFSILVIMLALNIVTVDEVALMLNLSPEAAGAFKAVISRIQEVTANLLNILSQLLERLLSWANVDVDLNKIEVDVNKPPVENKE